MLQMFACDTPVNSCKKYDSHVNAKVSVACTCEMAEFQ
jgi:hypothetical protein